MSLLTAANDEAVRLIREACGPVPKPLHARFLELVDRLLRNDEILIPAKVMEACRRVQAELLIAPAVDRSGRTNRRRSRRGRRFAAAPDRSGANLEG